MLTFLTITLNDFNATTVFIQYDHKSKLTLQSAVVNGQSIREYDVLIPPMFVSG